MPGSAWAKVAAAVWDEGLRTLPRHADRLLWCKGRTAPGGELAAIPQRENILQDRRNHRGEIIQLRGKEGRGVDGGDVAEEGNGRPGLEAGRG